MMKSKERFLKVHLIALAILILTQMVISQDTSEIEYYITKDKVALREQPIQNSKRVAILNKKDKVTLDKYYFQEAFADGGYGNYRKSISGVDTGYVFNPYISEITIQHSTAEKYIYVVDTFDTSIGIIEYKNANWYKISAKGLEPTKAPEIRVSDSLDVIHYDNKELMIASNLYLNTDIDYSFLFEHDLQVKDDVTYYEYFYQLLSKDTLLITPIYKPNESQIITLTNNSVDEYYFETINITKLLDVNGDGILDIFIDAANTHSFSKFLLVSNNGSLVFDTHPITFKIFPYEGC